MSSHDLLTRLALRETAEAYAIAVDRHDADLFAAQFAEDGVLIAPRGRFEGHAALRTVPPMMAGLYEATFHAVLSVTAELNGNAAKAETRCIARHFYHDTDGQYRCYEMTIRYQDDFVRNGERWLFSQRELVVDFTHNFAAGPPVRRRKTGSEDQA